MTPAFTIILERSKPNASLGGEGRQGANTVQLLLVMGHNLSISELRWLLKTETDRLNCPSRVEERPPCGEELPFESLQVDIFLHTGPTSSGQVVRPPQWVWGKCVFFEKNEALAHHSVSIWLQHH